MARAVPPNRGLVKAKTSFLRWALVRASIVYILSVLFLTCPSTPNHPVCQLGSLAHNSIVTPLHDIVRSTETGARIDTAYRAHLVPFYQTHAQPVVASAQVFVAESALPVLKQAAQPACDAVHRVLGPHIDRVSSTYVAHAKPSVDAIKHGVCAAANHVVIPVASTISSYSKVVAREYVRPVVSNYVVPVYVNHVQPRWNNHVRPALCRSVKVAVEYTQSSVVPAIVDGAARGARVASDFASTYIAPYARRATLHTYVFVKTKVCPPVHAAYAQTLKPHVDRVVPWNKIDPVLSKLHMASTTLIDFVWGFVEELYYMTYTIFTGDEHPSVVAKLRDTASKADVGEREVNAEGQLQGVARRLSGSARQWIQHARGWVGSAAGSAKDNLAVYGNRATATAKDMWQANVGAQTSNVKATVAVETNDVKATIAVETSDVQATQQVPVASKIESVVEAVVSSVTEAAQSVTSLAASLATEAAEPAESVFTSATQPVAAKWSEIRDKVKVHVQTVESDARRVAHTVESVAESVVESVMSEAVVTDAVESVESVADSVVEPAASDIAETVVSVADSVAETVVSVASEIVEPVVSVASDIAEPVVSVASDITEHVVESVVSVESAVTEVAGDVADSAVSVKNAVTEIVADKAASIKNDATEIIADKAASIKSAATEAAPVSKLSVVISDAIEHLTSVDEAASAESAAKAVTSAIASKLEKLEDVPSIPVPTMAAPSVAQNVSFVAEDAASAVYKARDAMAGVFVGDKERVEFSELVESAQKGVENLEDFPKILDDAQEAITEKVVNKASEATPLPVVSEPVKEAEDVKPKPVVAKTVEQAEEATLAAKPIAERAVDVSEPEVPKEPLSEQLPPADNIVVSEEPTHDDTVVEADSLVDDVRKSASNWVKDARKSISKELAEERTRTIAADAGTTLSDAVVVTSPESKAADAAPEEPAAQVLVDKTLPVSVSASQVEVTQRDHAEPSKSASPKPNASKSDKAVPAANVPAPDSSAEAQPAATKGPRKVKKVKRRMVKKTV
ncbi:hypothetical protein IWW56_000335 [Coemansia sp. RSA 2131]|nr:hypothetical protein IWW56_000335 [Coemansia sp. RSA 2131]